MNVHTPYTTSDPTLFFFLPSLFFPFLIDVGYLGLRYHCHGGCTMHTIHDRGFVALALEVLLSFRQRSLKIGLHR